MLGTQQQQQAGSLLAMPCIRKIQGLQASPSGCLLTLLLAEAAAPAKAQQAPWEQRQQWQPPPRALTVLPLAQAAVARLLAVAAAVRALAVPQRQQQSRQRYSQGLTRPVLGLVVAGR